MARVAVTQVASCVFDTPWPAVMIFCAIGKALPCTAPRSISGLMAGYQVNIGN
jgi:hypothetical protein